MNANAGVRFLSILFNGTSVKTQISPELQFLLIYLRTTFTNYFWLFEVVWFCCFVERHDLLKSIWMCIWWYCMLESRGDLVKIMKVRIRIRSLGISLHLLKLCSLKFETEATCPFCHKPSPFFTLAQNKFRL